MAKEVFPFRDEDTKFAVLKHSVTSTKTSFLKKKNIMRYLSLPPPAKCVLFEEANKEKVDKSKAS